MVNGNGPNVCQTRAYMVPRLRCATHDEGSAVSVKMRNSSLERRAYRRRLQVSNDYSAAAAVRLSTVHVAHLTAFRRESTLLKLCTLHVYSTVSTGIKIVVYATDRHNESKRRAQTSGKANLLQIKSSHLPRIRRAKLIGSS